MITYKPRKRPNQDVIDILNDKLETTRDQLTQWQSIANFAIVANVGLIAVVGLLVVVINA